MTISPEKGQGHTSKGKDSFQGSPLSYKACRYRHCMAFYVSIPFLLRVKTLKFYSVCLCPP